MSISKEDHNKEIEEGVNRKWEQFEKEYENETTLSEDELLDIYLRRLTIPELVWVSKKYKNGTH